MTTNKVIDINDLPEINTVADLIKYLQTLPQHLMPVKANMEGIGYNKIVIGEGATFTLQISDLPNTNIDFIDWDGHSNSFEAVVL